MTDLGVVPGTRYGRAAAIASGAIVGSILGREGQPHAARWAGGVITDLGILPTGGHYAAAMGVSTTGAIVGAASALSDWYTLHAVVWANGTLTDLGADRGDLSSSALGDNAAGVVVGTIETRSGDQPARWDHGQLTRLPALTAAGRGHARAISSRGLVVGDATDGWSTPAAVTWDASGALTVLPAGAGLTGTSAWAVNGAGDIGGQATDDTGVEPVLWLGGTTLRRLGTLPGQPAGTVCWVRGVGPSGLVAGACGPRAVVWHVE